MTLGSIFAAPLRSLRTLGRRSSRPRGASRSGSHALERASDRELGEALQHRHAAVRARAAQIIGSRGVTRATVALTRACYDSAAPVRQQALGALLAIDPEHFASTCLELAERLPQAELFHDIDLLMENVAASSGYGK